MFGWALKRLKNTVYFSVFGADCEKLLKAAIDEGIEIIKPKKKAYRMFGTVNAKDYKKLRFPARKNGLKIRIIKKNGLYFFIKRHKLKIGIALGNVFIILFILFLNIFIWDINIEGNTNISDEIIAANLTELGFKKGTLKYKHDEKTIEQYLVKENKNIASAQLNIQGCCANIIIREVYNPAVMKPDDDVPINIIASRYGVIRKINVFDGQDMVTVGDAVMKGDLLVSAVYEDSHNKLTLKHARAEVIAETDYVITVEFPLVQTIEKTGGIKKTIREFEIMGIKFRIGNDENYSDLPVKTENKKLRFLWIELPVYMTTKQYFDVKQKDITYNFEQGKAGAFKLLEEKEREELSGCEILSRKDTEKIKDNVYIITAEYICLMNIAEEQAIESEIPWENTDDMS